MSISRIQSAIHPDASPIFGGIAAERPGFFELADRDGRIRGNWRPFVDAFDAFGTERVQHLQKRAMRMRHEDGATYNPFADPNGRSSAWPLDLMPLPIDARDWQTIESGVVQRALLLEKILEDVYGPQHLLQSGIIPNELIFNNQNFLRPCHNIRPAGGRYLCFYAVDLYRHDDGAFRVLRDYASHPAGLGYALENRIVLTRVLSELYHTSQVLRLAPFFHRLHRAILERNALGSKDPGIVLLSSGPECPTYFEQAFLSRYLGYPLVEGQDLTVRNGRVYLKKLAGLEPVEAIFRQIDDVASDPFAFRHQSVDGVAGLVQAAREGTIDLINPLGAGFVDTPLLAALLPRLSRHLLAADLQLPGRPMRWGGDDATGVVTVAEGETVELAFDSSLPVVQGDELIDAIKLRPRDFLFCAPITPSLVPVWADDAASACPFLLRVFACATPEGFFVMPGGLATTAADVPALLADSPEVQRSKDVWVLSDQPVEPFSLLSSLQATTAFSRSSDLPSRVADNLLWLGRYLERAECRIRLLRAILRRISGEARLADVVELPFLLQLLGLPASDKQENTFGYRRLMTIVRDNLYDYENLDSIVAILLKVHETARNVRDRLSLDCWRVINHFEDFLDQSADDPLEVLDNTLYNLSAFSGLAMESMTRGLGWRFMDMGRRLERAMFQTAILQTGLPGVCDNPRGTLEALLEVGDSTMTYRARYRTTYQMAPVLDLLIIDESNPKSLAFQFSQLAAHVEYLPRQEERRYASQEERLTLELLTTTRLLDLQDISCGGDSHESLMNYLRLTEQHLLEFAQRITAHYLSRVPAIPHFSNHAGPGVG